MTRLPKIAVTGFHLRMHGRQGTLTRQMWSSAQLRRRPRSRRAASFILRFSKTRIKFFKYFLSLRRSSLFYSAFSRWFIKQSQFSPRCLWSLSSCISIWHLFTHESALLTFSTTCHCLNSQCNQQKCWLAATISFTIIFSLLMHLSFVFSILCLLHLCVSVNVCVCLCFDLVNVTLPASPILYNRQLWMFRWHRHDARCFSLLHFPNWST